MGIMVRPQLGDSPSLHMPTKLFGMSNVRTLRARRLQDWVRCVDTLGFSGVHQCKSFAPRTSLWIRQPTLDARGNLSDAALRL